MKGGRMEEEAGESLDEKWGCFEALSRPFLHYHFGETQWLIQFMTSS